MTLVAASQAPVAISTALRSIAIRKIMLDSSCCCIRKSFTVSTHRYLSSTIATTRTTNVKNLATTTQFVSNFSTKPAAAVGEYFNQKKAEKERRRELYEKKMDRRERLKTRRKNNPNIGMRSKEFRSWFDPTKSTNEFMDRKARKAGMDWRMEVAVLLERDQVVLPDLQDWQYDYFKLKDHLAQFGKQYPPEFAEVMKQPSLLPPTEEELLKDLPRGVKIPPRITEADLNGDVRTLDRQLKSIVYFVVQNEVNDKDIWQVPTVSLQEDESLWEASNRALKTTFDDDIDYWAPSNFPCAVHMTPFDESQRNEVGLYGTKTFYTLVHYHKGAIQPDKLKNAKDFAWLTKNEIMDKLGSQEGGPKKEFYKYAMR